jgi:hypothetical protein
MRLHCQSADFYASRAALQVKRKARANGKAVASRRYSENCHFTNLLALSLLLPWLLLTISYKNYKTNKSKQDGLAQMC